MTIGIEEGSPLMEDLLGLVQAGVYVECRPDLSARDFMRQVLGLDDDYIEKRISTLFLDSEPVDDIDAARVRAGSRIALSAAMPGLVGAVMRRGSPLASFRAGISHDDRAETGEGKTASGAPAVIGTVQVKYFNAVMAERGPALLERGILLPLVAAVSFARDHGLELPVSERPDSLVPLRAVAAGGVPS